MNKILSSPLFWAATLIGIAVLGYILYNQVMVPVNTDALSPTTLDADAGTEPFNDSTAIGSAAPSSISTSRGIA